MNREMRSFVGAAMTGHYGEMKTMSDTVSEQLDGILDDRVWWACERNDMGDTEWLSAFAKEIAFEMLVHATAVYNIGRKKK